MKMPKKGSRRWWRLWLSGAFDPLPVIRERWLQRLEGHAEKCPQYFLDDVRELRARGRIENPAVSSLDALAVVFGDLRMFRFERRATIQDELVR